MTSNQRNPWEVKLSIPGIEQSTPDEEAKNPANGSSQKPKIQKVPSVLKSVKADFNKCFEPRLVALGPFHHDNPKFERSQQVKCKFATLFAKENGKTEEDLLNKIRAEIDDLKKCYDAEDISDFDDDMLARMFFVDGSAVLYAIHYGIKGDFKKLGTKADRLVFAQLDLFLLENQLPYQVLKILIRSTPDPRKWEKSITDLIHENLITNIRSRKRSQRTEAAAQGVLGNSRTEAAVQCMQGNSRTEAAAEDIQDYSHLLQRLRNEHLAGQGEESKSSMIGGMLLRLGDKRRNKKTFRSMKELKESGIHVKPSNSNNLKNISFYCNFMGSLKMPRLMVDDSTASKFMNLVALEMCQDFGNDFEVTSYLCFMDTLIDTAEDVKVLRRTGMLHNYLGSDEEVADLFNKMSRDLVPDQEMYSDVTENIHNYCNNDWTSNAAQAYYTHFSNPWTCLGFSAAIMGLLFSAIQAYCSLFKSS